MPVTTAATTDGAMTAAAAVIGAHAVTSAGAADSAVVNAAVPAAPAVPAVGLDAVLVGVVLSVADATAAVIEAHARARLGPVSLPARP